MKLRICDFCNGVIATGNDYHKITLVKHEKKIINDHTITRIENQHSGDICTDCWNKHNFNGKNVG